MAEKESANTSTSSTSTTKKSNEIKLKIKVDFPVEIINTDLGSRSIFVPREDTPLRLNNHNLYKIQITDSELDIDKSNLIKVNYALSEFLQILGVQNGVVIVNPIINGFTLENGQVIGKLI